MKRAVMPVGIAKEKEKEKEKVTVQQGQGYTVMLC